MLYTFLSIFATFFLFYKIIQSLKPNNKKLPPSPPSYPILGHLHLLKPPFHRTLQSLAQRYGPIFSLQLGLQRALVVSSAWAAEECFSQNDVVFAKQAKIHNRTTSRIQLLNYYLVPIWGLLAEPTTCYNHYHVIHETDKRSGSDPET